ncbi:MAG: UDP-N-acetylglucosamine 4,6-dehydratase (inverting) [Patescibacteria group bacterium]|nr:UDP-N-acetylglucosamine 4,6-dehydratase (inverting) [Patescibacteria group bacterium]
MANLIYLKGKTVLVTGGTGTFGRAFVAKLLKESDVKKIIIFSRDEFKQSEVQRDLAQHAKRLRFFIGDIRDLQRLERAFEGVDIVVHAAALKQVPAIEFNPFEAVKTNILGSQNVIEAALNKNVERAVLISSDKAVQPINLYGATKLAAERLFIAANVYPGDVLRTKFSVMRYGNVIGSRGSLIEMIEKQKSTGVIKLTDDRMTRFWISVDKVLDIILTVMGEMEGGEIFVPKMPSMKVSDVIKFLAPKCKMELIGIRPGEKLHEVLITEYEAPRTKDIGIAYAVQPEFGSEAKWLEKKPHVKADFTYASNNKEFLRGLNKAKEVLK